MPPRKQKQVPDAEPVAIDQPATDTETAADGDAATADAGPELRTWEVTELAGPRVAGKRSPGVGKTVELTEEQAATELLAGALKEVETGKGQGN